MVPLTVTGRVTACAVPRVLFDSTSATVGGGGGVVPPAASTAALASTMPAPHCEQVAGNGRADDFSLAATSSGVSDAFFDSISATTPATCGVAIDVPW